MTTAVNTCRHGVPNGRDCGCCDLSPDPGIDLADALVDAADVWIRDPETPPKLACLLSAMCSAIKKEQP